MITDKAEPGTVIGTKELCVAAGKLCTWATVGPHELKGIDGRVELFRAELRKAEDAI